MATRESILNKLDIKDGDWVLEIGSGPMPFVRSDILADKFLIDNLHRIGKLIIDRPTVVCDAHYLPFVDNGFDYTFCSQTLEHLDNPDLFFKEIVRVSKKGYIETPNEIRERLFGWPFHKWVVSKDEKGLILKENNVESPFGLFFHKLQLENYEFVEFSIYWHDLLNICYEWHNKPEYRFETIRGKGVVSEKLYIDENIASTFKLSKPIKKGIYVPRWLKKKIPVGIKQIIKQNLMPPKFGCRHSENESKLKLKNILACPKCKEKITYVEINKLNCRKCKRNYEINNSIPIML
jgi:SAM-dependent methyltransferase